MSLNQKNLNCVASLVIEERNFGKQELKEDQEKFDYGKSCIK